MLNECSDGVGSLKKSEDSSIADPPSEIGDRWTVVESTDLYRDDWVIALRQDMIQRSDADQSDMVGRLVLEHPGSAVALAIDEEDRAICLSQYRHSLGRRFIELPAGLCDVPGEHPLNVAQRELQEEAGLIARSWSNLSVTCPSLGLSTETVHIYLARGLSAAPHNGFTRRHEEAGIEVFRVPFDDLLVAALAGRLANAQLVMAVMAYRLLSSAIESHTESGLAD